MQHKQTLAMALATVGIIGVVALVGFMQSQSQTGPAPAQQATEQQPQQSTSNNLSDKQLDTRLTSELDTISLVIAAEYPQLPTLYAIDRGKLYQAGEWYATTLTYQGSATDNRDTLRLLMQKKDGVWTMRSTPPEPLLTQPSYPDVPKAILQDINKPTVLPGTDTSPTITQD